MLAHTLGLKLLSRTKPFEEKMVDCELTLTEAATELKTFVDRYLNMKSLMLQHCAAGTFSKELALQVVNICDEFNAASFAWVANLSSAALFASMNSDSLSNFSRLPDGSTPATAEYRCVWPNRLHVIEQQAAQIIRQIGFQQADVTNFLRRLNQEKI